MDNVRILKGYSKEERRELEEAKDGGFSSTMTLIYGIGEDYGDCHALFEKYYHEDANDSNQLAKDIADFYCGKAKFAEQKYYVKLIRNNESSYLNRSTTNNFCMVCGCKPDEIFQTEFTEDEIKDIDPRYMAFAVPVEEYDE